MKYIVTTDVNHTLISISIVKCKVGLNLDEVIDTIIGSRQRVVGKPAWFRISCIDFNANRVYRKIAKKAPGLMHRVDVISVHTSEFMYNIACKLSPKIKHELARS